jgi:hypothetical protein
MRQRAEAAVYARTLGEVFPIWAVLKTGTTINIGGRSILDADTKTPHRGGACGRYTSNTQESRATCLCWTLTGMWQRSDEDVLSACK